VEAAAPARQARAAADTELACGCLAGAIFHSEHGSLYTSKDYATLCKDLGVVQSMGAAGSSADNALAESFNASLKREILPRRCLTRSPTTPATPPGSRQRRNHPPCPRTGDETPWTRIGHVPGTRQPLTLQTRRSGAVSLRWAILGSNQ
jgi:transposase InsO family protein